MAAEKQNLFPIKPLLYKYWTKITQIIFTQVQKQADHVVPLKAPVDVSKLCAGGESFELKDPSGLSNDENLTSNAAFEPSEILRNCYLPDDDSDSDEDDISSPFQKLSKKMTDLSGDGGVLKKILQHGSGNVVPKEALVRVHLNGYLEYSDEPFDSSRLRNREIKRKLGKGDWLLGLDIGVSTMKKGELARFLLTYPYAFGKMGSPPRIPAEATVMFEVELLSFVEHAGVDDFNFLSEEERQKVSFSDVKKVYTAEKQEGKQLFDARQFGKAFKHYRKAATILEDFRLKDEEEEREQQQMLLKMYDHMALCSSKMAQVGRCINYCKQMLEIDPDNVRAFYYYGKSLHQNQEFERAKHYLLKARNLKPNDKCINQELEKLDRNIKNFNIMERDMYSRMFSKPQGSDTEKKQNKPKKESHATDNNFAKLAKEKLEEFKSSDDTEMPFPSHSMSPKEVATILELVDSLGLNARECGSGQNYRIKIEKRT